MHRAALQDIQTAVEIEPSRELTAELRRAQEMLRACIRRAPKVAIPVKLMSSVELPPTAPPAPVAEIQAAEPRVPPQPETRELLEREESTGAGPAREKKVEAPRIPSQKVMGHSTHIALALYGGTYHDSFSPLGNHRALPFPRHPLRPAMRCSGSGDP